MTSMPTPLEVLYEDSWLIAVNKPNGMLVHPGKTPEPREHIAMKVLRDQLGDRYVYPAHRLDRPTSGVLLFALDQETEVKLKEQFAGQQVHKEYLALVYGNTPEAWSCVHPLSRGDKEPLQACHTDFAVQAQRASMHAETPLTLLAVRPRTGRMHQIRKHLAHDGFRLLGDYLYGDHALNADYEAWSGLKRLMLHSRALSFIHPRSGEPILIEAQIPDGFS